MKREYDFSKGKRGPVVPSEPGKTRITIRLDNEVLAHFRKQVHEMGGGNYQTLINDALREHIRRGGIEAVVRRAMRFECEGSSLTHWWNGRSAPSDFLRFCGKPAAQLKRAHRRFGADPDDISFG